MSIENYEHNQDVALKAALKRQSALLETVSDGREKSFLQKAYAIINKEELTIATMKEQFHDDESFYSILNTLIQNGYLKIENASFDNLSVEILKTFNDGKIILEPDEYTFNKTV